jgi:TatD DNase family protein
MLVDSHAHIFKNYYDDIGEVIKRSKAAGVEKIIIASDSIKEAYECIELGNKYDEIYFCLGIHPENCDDSLKTIEELINENLDNPKFVGIGEIGLDYHWNKENIDKQKEVFEYQLKLADKYNLPVEVHTRDAIEDAYEILSKYPNLKVDIHCFCYDETWAKKFIDKGYYLGIGGIVTFKSSDLINVLESVGIDNIIFETDSPYLSPDRGKQNEPANIKYIAQFISNKLGISQEILEKKSYKNLLNLFDI